MRETELVHTAEDGTGLHVFRWDPDGPARGVVQVVHGASEHAGRYRRLAEVLTSRGHVVVAHDQRGHGRSAVRFGRPGVARPGGWKAMLADVHHLAGAARCPGGPLGDLEDLPLVLLGHSMGAAVVQGSLPDWFETDRTPAGPAGRTLVGVILSGPPQLPTDPGLVGVLEEAAAGDAADAPSALFASVFDGYNAPFVDPDQAGEVTGFEWLSRDAHEVRAYVDDPLCGSGVPLTNGFVLDMFRDGLAAASPERLGRLPADLAVLVVAGDRDPVPGGGAGAFALGEALGDLGLAGVEVRVYTEGRHEMLNEVNRDEVHDEVAAWVDARIP